MTGKSGPGTGRRWWEWEGLGWPRAWQDVRFRDVAAFLLVGFTVWGYIDVSRRGRIVSGHPEFHRTDFTVFTEAGLAFSDGRHPYEVTNPRGWYYLYPPLFALLVAPLGQLDSEAQVSIWFAISIAAGFACFFESRRLWGLLAPQGDGRPGPPSRLATWVSACAGLAVLLPTFDCLQRGQLGVVLMYPTLLGLRLAIEERSGWRSVLAGVVLAWPMVVKLVPALPVGCLVVHHWMAIGSPSGGGRPSARRAAAFTGGVLAGLLLFVFVVPASLIGWGPNLAHLQTWVRKVAANQEVGQSHGFHIDSLTNQSLTNAAHLFAAEVTGRRVSRAKHPHWFIYDTKVAERRRADHVTRDVVRVARVLILLTLGLIVVVSGLREGRSGAAGVFGLACLAIVLISPLAWAHYYMIWLPPILLVTPWLAGRGWTATGMVLAAAPVGLTWAHYLLLRWCGQVGLLGLGATLWFAVAAGLMLTALVGRRPSAAASHSKHRSEGAHGPFAPIRPTAVHDHEAHT